MSFGSSSVRMLLAAGALWLCAPADANAAGKCELPPRLTVSAPEALRPALADFTSTFAGDGQADPASAFLRFILTGDGTPEHPQGYQLEISGSGITVRARTVEGLFNGLQALNDLRRRSADGTLPQLRTTEVPAVAERALSLSFAQTTATTQDIRVLKRLMTMLAALRYNRLLIDFGDDFKLWTEEPTVRAERIKELDDFARTHFITITPLSRGWKKCPMSAAERRELRADIRRRCETLKPEKFFFRLDRNELESHRHDCENCRNTAPEKLIAEHLAFLAECAGDCKVRPAFILLNFPDDLALRAAAALPARTPIYGVKGAKRTPDTAQAGESAALLREISDSVDGGAQSFIVQELIYTRPGAIRAFLRNSSPDFLNGMVRGAFAMWSPKHAPPDDPTRYFGMLTPRGAKALRSRRATPVAIWAQLTAELGSTGEFPCFEDQRTVDEMRRALLDLPERFDLAVCFGARYYGALLAGNTAQKLPEQVDIPLGGAKASGVAMLVSCSPPKPPEDFDPSRNGKYAFAHFDVVKVAVTYADGSRDEMALKYRQHISGWDETFGGRDRRTAFIGRDARGRKFRFDAVTIRTDPGKPIAKLTFRSLRNCDVAPVLLALSLLDADGGSLPTPDLGEELLQINFQLPRK